MSIDNFEHVAISRTKEGWRADSITMANDPSTLLSKCGTLKQFGLSYTEEELAVEYTPERDNIKRMEDQYLDVKKEIAKDTIQRVFSVNNKLRVDIGDAGWMVFFKMGSVSFVSDTALSVPGETFGSFIENHKLPESRYENLETLRKQAIQNELWWKFYKNEHKHDETFLKISKLALCFLLNYYPSPGMQTSDSNTLTLWKNTSLDGDYIGVARVVGSIAMTIDDLKLNEQLSTEKLAYIFASRGRDALRFDYIEPRITEICRIQL